MDPYTLFWIVLFAVGGIVEMKAVLNNRKGDTFSEHVWKINRLAAGLLDRRGTRRGVSPATDSRH